jgi:erythromycin esterase-like protein
MSHSAPIHATLDDWIAREAIPFSVDSRETINAAVDKMIASLGDSVQWLGSGEALHGGEDILILRNRLFQRLVETHGYNAIAVESSFPRERVVNEYVAGRGTDHQGPHGDSSRAKNIFIRGCPALQRYISPK